MKHFLQVGHVFRCAAFGDLDRHGALAHEHRWEGARLLRSETELHPDHCQRVTWYEKEKRPDGWKRETERELDLRPTATDLGERLWTVKKTAFGGGGTGHGEHDVFPDGHHVTATSDDGLKVRFSQSGCFVGMIEPAQVELVRGDDTPTVWKKTQTLTQERVKP